MSEDTPRKEMLLTTMIIACLSKYLADQLQKESGGMNGEDGDSGDYGDYGDYGSDDEYGTEDIGGAKRAFGNDVDFGMGAGAGFGENFDVGAFEDVCDVSDGGFDEGDGKKINAEEKLLTSIGGLSSNQEGLQDVIRATLTQHGEQTV